MPQMTYPLMQHPRHYVRLETALPGHQAQAGSPPGLVTGAAVERKRCTQCGYMMSSELRFCGQCAKDSQGPPPSSPSGPGSPTALQTRDPIALQTTLGADGLASAMEAQQEQQAKYSPQAAAE